jgi:hypothetical protein
MEMSEAFDVRLDNGFTHEFRADEVVSEEEDGFYTFLTNKKGAGSVCANDVVWIKRHRSVAEDTSIDAEYLFTLKDQSTQRVRGMMSKNWRGDFLFYDIPKPDSGRKPELVSIIRKGSVQLFKVFE